MPIDHSDSQRSLLLKKVYKNVTYKTKSPFAKQGVLQIAF